MARDVCEAVAEENGLTYVHDHDPGILRRGTAPAHDYEGPDGRPLRDPTALERIRRLAIPPAWTRVWICPDARGHIQAVGRDARGRKQYRYHATWRAFRDEAKFGRMEAFGRALPRLRTQIAADLRRHGLAKEKVLAAVVSLLQTTLIRIGNDEYVRRNKSFGLTTLRKRHVRRLSGAGAVFEFRGKSGVEHKTEFHDARLARVLYGCENLPGQRLFQFIDHEGLRHAVGSADVNAYIRSAVGEDFSAKDVRTWAGTLLAARALAMQPRPTTAGEAKRSIALCVKAVAGVLGNTPTVCRACYIHPAVLQAYETGALPTRLGREGRPAELALLNLLRTAAA